MKKIAIIGLGYVGLPLAVEFSKYHNVVGYDIDQQRVNELCEGVDRTNELEEPELKGLENIRFTSDPKNLKDCNIFIVTVPTPISSNKLPDLSPLKNSSQLVGNYLSIGDLVIYESTVYPGTTEEICVPILESASGLIFNEDFTVGYSPERINPGDKINRLPNIIKVTSGSTPETALKVDTLYQEIVKAGTYSTPSIKVAEASKIIENTQRDVNISLINEFAGIFERLGIDTHDVLDAASTKWNFNRYEPGLVGGHCIGVDPYYLIYRAQEVDYFPELLLAARRINNRMPTFVVQRVLKEAIKRKLSISDISVLILGATFKENCSDMRNTLVADIYVNFVDLGFDVDVHDPVADTAAMSAVFGNEIGARADNKLYDVLLLAVPHNEYLECAFNIQSYLKPDGFILDLKSRLPRQKNIIRL
jgi:UDP-N-acetyl-D-glucosamine/UDP-N-acetyl-D-galactosamine dehydrogenase